jgi:predicted phage terminase large subunit-like protein
MALLKKTKNPEERWAALVLRVSSATAGQTEQVTEREARINRARVDYDFFVTTYFPHYTKDKLGNTTNCAPYHVDAANDVLANQEFTGFWMWFRGSAKSTHANIFLPMWLKIQTPVRQLNVMLLIGKNSKTATRLLQDIQVELQHNELYIRDFGHQIKDGSWEQGEFQTADGCAFVALGMGQPPRGTRFGAQRPDYIVMDDTDDDKLKKSPARVTEVVEWVHRAVLPTMDSGIMRFLFVNNFIARKGLMARLVAEHPDWYMSRVDAMDKKGNPTWSRHSKEHFARLRKKVKEKAFLSEYMNDPQEDGGVFTLEQIKWRPALSDWTQYDALVMYGDPSFSTSEKADFFSIPLWAKRGTKFTKLKVYHRQRETASKAIKWWFKYYYGLPLKVRVKLRCYVESNATQKEILRPLIEAEAKRTGLPNFIKFDTSKKGDKEDRISSMTTQYENEDVEYNSAEQSDPDMLASIEQLTGWTEGGGQAMHDDGPDADESAWRKLEKAGKRSGRAGRETRSKGFKKSTSRSY